MNFSFEEKIIFENEVALLRPVEISDFDRLLKVATQHKDLLQYSPIPIYSEHLFKIIFTKQLITEPIITDILLLYSIKTERLCRLYLLFKYCQPG